MLEALFGADMPLAVRFFLAFLIVLGLIGATAWAVRRFGAGRLGGAGARGRQPRLAVIDYASVDSPDRPTSSSKQTLCAPRQRHARRQ